MEMHFATVWEAIADAVPDAPAVVQGDGLTWSDYEHAPPGSPRRSSTPASARRQGRAVPLQLPRVPRGPVRRHEAATRTGQRQLPLPRRGVAVPARQRRRRGARLPFVARRAGRRGGRPPAQAAAARRGRRRRRAPAGSTAPCDTRRWSAAHEAGRPDQRPEDDVYMLYTGGTTGMPKGVMYAIGGITAGARSNRATPASDCRCRHRPTRSPALVLGLRDGGRAPVVDPRVPAHARHRHVARRHARRTTREACP